MSVAEEILTELKELLYFPKRLRMPNLLLIGEANNGKTNIINRFYKLHGSPHDENERLVMPVILAHAPASSNEKDMYIAILESMNMPYQSKKFYICLVLSGYSFIQRIWSKNANHRRISFYVWRYAKTTATNHEWIENAMQPVTNANCGG